MFARLISRLAGIAAHESNVLIVMAVAVGIASGVGAVTLEEAIKLVTHLFYGSDDPLSNRLWLLVAAPAVGGLVVGPLTVKFAREAKGHGVPEVIEAVALRGGRIRARVALVKTLASAITIGTGGSAGREGPIVQIGAAIGSRIGSRLRMSDERVRLLVACGAAGGIAASFNAPLAGVFFALEVILQRFSTRGFGTVVISAVTASVIWRTAFGNQPVFEVPAFGLVNPVEMTFYVVLGVSAGVLAVVFVKLLYGAEDVFARLPIPEAVIPGVGGLLLGGVGVVTVLTVGQPLIYGNGVPGIDAALDGNLIWWVPLVLLAGKMAGTTFTLGSGGSGGVFAPSLFMGAMLGTLVGMGANALAPTATAAVGAYAMVGMASVFAGAAQAPISAILILFEMTNDYLIILPLMLSCIVSTAVYAAIQGDSIYMLKIRRKGIELSEGRQRHLMERIPVSEAILDEFTALVLPASLVDVGARMNTDGIDWLICVDEEERFLGMLSREVVTTAVLSEDVLPLEELLDTDVLPVIPTESLDDAFSKIAPRGLRILPVIQDLSSRLVIGAVTRDSLTGAYWSALASQGSGEGLS